jgi:hypothetical protein
MKYTLAIAALLAVVSAEEPVWSLRSVNDHRTDSQLQHAYGEHSTKAANARPPYQSTAQLQSEDSEDSSDDLQLGDEEDHSGEFYPVGAHGQEGAGAYDRKTTGHFSADSDDIFMRSMIEQYALEGKNKDGSPNGQFWLDEAGAKAAAGEVLATHKGIKGAAADKYFATYWKKAWGHFDVNVVGKIEVIKAP